MTSLLRNMFSIQLPVPPVQRNPIYDFEMRHIKRPHTAARLRFYLILFTMIFALIPLVLSVNYIAETIVNPSQYSSNSSGYYAGSSGYNLITLTGSMFGFLSVLSYLLMTIGDFYTLFMTVVLNDLNRNPEHWDTLKLTGIDPAKVVQAKLNIAHMRAWRFAVLEMALRGTIFILVVIVFSNSALNSRAASDSVRGYIFLLLAIIAVILAGGSALLFLVRPDHVSSGHRMRNLIVALVIFGIVLITAISASGNTGPDDIVTAGLFIGLMGFWIYYEPYWRMRTMTAIGIRMTTQIRTGVMQVLIAFGVVLWMRIRQGLIVGALILIFTQVLVLRPFGFGGQSQSIYYFFVTVFAAVLVYATYAFYSFTEQLAIRNATTRIFSREERAI